MTKLTPYVIAAWIMLPLAYTLLAGWVWGHEGTITGTVQKWSEKSIAPEAFFVMWCLVMYLHLFRKAF
jgi:hypothetical protein